MPVNNHPGFRKLGSVIGKLWNAPTTALGLVWGVIGLPFSWTMPSFGNNALQFENHPFMAGGAVTFGNVICYHKGEGPNDPMIQESPYTYGDHERQHTFQGEILGPFYLPLYIILGLYTMIGGGGFISPDNPMEAGPYLPETTDPYTPPRPWR